MNCTHCGDELDCEYYEYCGEKYCCTECITDELEEYGMITYHIVGGGEEE